MPLHAPARHKPGEEAGNAQPQVLGNDPETRRTDLAAQRTLRPLRAARRRREAATRRHSQGHRSLRAVDFEYALKLLSLPREVGKHPETGKPITANFGRYGPYVAHDGQYASLDCREEVFTVGLNRAVTVLAEKKANRAARAARKR